MRQVEGRFSCKGKLKLNPEDLSDCLFYFDLGFTSLFLRTKERYAT